MVQILVALAIVFVLGAWGRMAYRQARDRPLWVAFSTTTAALLFACAGLAGYTLSRHDRFVARTAWADHIIWPQVWIGMLAGLAAVYFWRRAIREP